MPPWWKSMSRGWEGGDLVSARTSRGRRDEKKNISFNLTPIVS